MSSDLPLSADEGRRGGTVARPTEAAGPGQSAWVSAHAGTGTTKVLPDRGSRLVWVGTQPRKIPWPAFSKSGERGQASRLL